MKAHGNDIFQSFTPLYFSFLLYISFAMVGINHERNEGKEEE